MEKVNMLKRGLAIVLTMCMIVVLFPNMAVKAGVVESMQNAQAIEYEMVYDGISNNKADQRWYTFTAKKGYNDYDVIVTNTTSLGIELYAFVYDENAATLENECISNGQTKTFKVHLVENHKYYICIYSARDEYSINYSFRVNSKSEEPDNKEEASKIKWGTLYNNYIHDKKDEDWYKFVTGSYVDKYKFEFSNPNLYQSVSFEVFDKNMQSIYKNCFGASQNETKSFELDKKSTYYIKVYSGYHDDAEYAFKVTKSAISSLEETPSIDSLTGKSKGMKIVLKKSKHASGYQIRYSTKSSMRGDKTINVKSTSKSINGLKKNTTYYVQVRAYTKNSKGKTVYSKWAGSWLSNYYTVRTK